MEDEEGGAGGSGTEAGDANKRCASGAAVTGVKRKAVPNNSHSSPELTPPREELGEEVREVEGLGEGQERGRGVHGVCFVRQLAAFPAAILYGMALTLNRPAH